MNEQTGANAGPALRRAADRAAEAVADGMGPTNQHPAAQHTFHLEEAASYRKAAAIHPPSAPEMRRGAREELAAAASIRKDALSSETASDAKQTAAGYWQTHRTAGARRVRGPESQQPRQCAGVAIRGRNQAAPRREGAAMRVIGVLL